MELQKVLRGQQVEGWSWEIIVVFSSQPCLPTSATAIVQCTQSRSDDSYYGFGRLELARELQINKLIVQLDDQACVKMLLNQDSGRNVCTHMLNRCLEMIQQDDWEVRVVHVYREGNWAADRLPTMDSLNSSLLSFILLLP